MSNVLMKLPIKSSPSYRVCMWLVIIMPHDYMCALYIIMYLDSSERVFFISQDSLECAAEQQLYVRVCVFYGRRELLSSLSYEVPHLGSFPPPVIVDIS
jgi:hypothetical protein